VLCHFSVWEMVLAGSKMRFFFYTCSDGPGHSSNMEIGDIT